MTGCTLSYIEVQQTSFTRPTSSGYRFMCFCPYLFVVAPPLLDISPFLPLLSLLRRLYTTCLTQVHVFTRQLDQYGCHVRGYWAETGTILNVKSTTIANACVLVGVIVRRPYPRPLPPPAGFAIADCDKAFKEVGYEIDPVLNWLFSNA